MPSGSGGLADTGASTWWYLLADTAALTVATLATYTFRPATDSTGWLIG